MNTLWQGFEAIAAERGGAPALIQGERVVGFGELGRMARGTAAALAARGLRPGGRCLIWSRNSAELAAAMLATWRQGGVVTLVNDQAPPTHFTHAARVTQPDLALVEEDLLPQADAAGAPVLPLAEVSGRGLALPAPNWSHAEEPASVFFTSGSTGLPKGVTQSQANLLSGCRRVASYLGLRRDDVILCPIPWAFDYGFGQLLSTLMLGVTQVIPEARNPFVLCNAIARHKPTVLAGLPSIFALLTRGLSPIRETDMHSVRLVTNTGGKIAPSVFADICDIFGHCRISLNYGMTETYRSAGLPPELARQHPESVGFAYPGVAIAVLREDGTEAAPGEVGEVVHRGAGAFLGYWGAPEATSAVRRPDPLWTHAGVAAPMAVFSGDLGWKDERGLLYVKGRKDRLIKSMGVRVSPDEVENLLRASGLVRDVAVVGLPNDIAGELVGAAVIPQDGAPDPLRSLKAFARERMSDAMMPRVWKVLDAFPLTPNGKPDFAGIRSLLEKGAPQ
jgi:acyl-coenzyme A synthetase/AMP-(fatty) acid ligase